MSETSQDLTDIVGNLARHCSALVMECAEANGHVQTMSDRMNLRVAQLGRLEKVTIALADDQRQVTNAVIQAQRLSNEIQAKLLHGRASITESVAGFSEVTDLVLQLGDRINRIIGALADVQEVSALISGIAKQTNMLALNAAIEAARAGESGGAFAIVATEVKKLAQHTREATDRINDTISALADEADHFGQEISTSVEKSKAAAVNIAAIETTVQDIGTIVDLVDEQSAGISRSAGQMQGSIAAVRDEMTQAAESVRANGAALGDVRNRLEKLETLGNAMLDKVANSGIEIDDSRNIKIALDVAAEITAIVEGAINRGTLSAADVFDFDYQRVPGSNPEQYTTRFNSFADTYIRPILDRMKHDVEKSIGSVISDINGYLPTHLSLRSQPQGADPEWNNTWSRNRRIMMDACTQRAIANESTMLLNCYRMTLGKGHFLPLKSVFVPLRFHGRRWGNYEFAYVDEYTAMAESISPAALAESIAKARGAEVPAAA